MRSSSSKIVLGAMICAIVLAASSARTAMAQNSPDDYVNAHNAARAAVGVGPVSWDDTVAAYAQDYANQLIGDCQLVHSGGPYGENLIRGSDGGSSPVQRPVDNLTAQDAVDEWVKEQQYYDYDSNSCASGKECGHYTQVVWADSTSIGCARVVCGNGGAIIICSYNPPGNVVGQRPY